MKGFIEHLINENDKVERELARDLDNIQAPYLIEEFSNWRPESGIPEATTIQNYTSCVRSLDQLIVRFGDDDKDLHALLQYAFTHKDFDHMSGWLDEYDAEITQWLKWSKTANDPDSRPNHFSDMRAGFRCYRTFIEEQAKRVQSSAIPTTHPPTMKSLFLEEDFKEWLKANGMKGNSSASTVSRIKSLNQDFLCKLIPGKTVDILDQLPRFIRETEDKTSLLLDKLIARVNHATEHPQTVAIHPATLRYMRRAFFLYAQFIKEKINNRDTTETRARQEEENELEKWTISGTEATNYEYDEIENNFRQRLLSQDRISESKSIFFPIRLIRRIFTLNDTLEQLKNPNSPNLELKWLYRWADNYAATAKAITDKGMFTLADIDWLEIASQPRTTTVLLPDGKKAVLQTQTDKGETLPMEVVSLDEITIDHTPSMAEVLNTKASELPALAQLTNVVRKQAQEKDIPLNMDNLSRLNNAVLNHTEFTELVTLIPQLKKELTLISQVSTLTLMNKYYNLRKK